MTEPVVVETTRFENGRSLTSIVAEIREELKEFLNTRYRMIRSEVEGSLKAQKTAVPLALVALALFAVAGLLLTSAVVAVIAAGFAGNAYAWVYAFAIVGGMWIGFGGIAAFFAVRTLKRLGRSPRRTAEVLKADRIWLRNEARIHS